MSGFALAATAAGFYIFAAFVQWLVATGRRQNSRGLVRSCTAIAALLHIGYVAATMFKGDEINLAFLQVGSLISLVITLLLLFSSWRKPVDNLLIGLLPMAAVILLTASIFHQIVIFTELSYGLTWHILLSILAYSTFTIASMQAVLVMLQDQHLRKHQTRGLVQALPSLQTMDVLLFEMIWLGMILLTAAFAIGWPHVIDIKGQHLIHKVAFGCIGWLVFAGLLFGRYRFGWRGVIASRWTLVGTGFLVMSYFGSRFVLEVILHVSPL